MHPFEAPGMTLGPGSQPSESDGAELSYLQYPSAMQTYQPPILPEPVAGAASSAGLDFLGRLLEQIRHYRVGEPSLVMDAQGLAAPDRHLVAQALGEGEVSILFAAGSGLRVQETRLAGVWVVQAQDASGRLVSDTLEIADIPRCVRELAFQGAATSASLGQDAELPEGVLTARSVLAELNEAVPAWRVGELPYIVNLTLLPHTPQDLAWLEQRLGAGPLTILSRGYGNCRITATGLRHCWWVRHFNSDDRLILDTLEVVDVPTAALAAREDLEDSAERLLGIIEALA